MLPLLQSLVFEGFAGIVLVFVVSVLTVAFGTYVGVLMALQSFFGVSDWDELDGEG